MSVEAIGQFRVVALKATRIVEQLRGGGSTELLATAKSDINQLGHELGLATQALANPKAAGPRSQMDDVIDAVKTIIPHAELSVTRRGPGGLDVPNTFGRHSLKALAADEAALRHMGRDAVNLTDALEVAERVERIGNHAARAAVLLEMPPYEAMTEGGRDVIRAAALGAQRGEQALDPFEEAIGRDLLAQRADGFLHANTSHAPLVRSGSATASDDPVAAAVDEVLRPVAKELREEQVQTYERAKSAVATGGWADNLISQLPSTAPLPPHLTPAERIHELSGRLVEARGAVSDAVRQAELVPGQDFAARVGSLKQVGELADQRAEQLHAQLAAEVSRPL